MCGLMSEDPGMGTSENQCVRKTEMITVRTSRGRPSMCFWWALQPGVGNSITMQDPVAGILIVICFS